jgi:CBS domain-containing protein
MDTMATIRDVHRAVLVADAGDRLVEVACRLRDADADALIVMDGGRIAGIITGRDLVEAVADGVDLHRSTAADHAWMTAPAVELGTGVDEAARVLVAAGGRTLVVVSGGAPVGTVSARDLLAASAR